MIYLSRYLFIAVFIYRGIYLSRDFNPQYSLDFVDVFRIVHTTTAFHLVYNRSIHVALLRQFFLREFLFASRGPHRVRRYLAHVFRFFHVVIRCCFVHAHVGKRRRCCGNGFIRGCVCCGWSFVECYGRPVLTVRNR